MTTAHQYAKALHTLVAKSPAEGKKLLSNLRAALKRRGHEKLLPQIYSEYQKLETAHARKERFAKVTPASERTRALFELYKKLVTHHSSTNSL